MLRKGELQRLRPLLLFFLVYTLLFLLWRHTFFYTLPLLLGLLLAGAVQPVIRFLDRRWGWDHTVSTALVTGAALAALLGALGVLGVYAVREAAAFLARASSGGFPQFTPQVTQFFQRVGGFLSQLDLDFLRQNQEEILEWVKNSLGLILSFLGTLLGVLTSLPTLVTLVLVVIFSAFFFSRDMGKLRDWARGFLSDEALARLRGAVRCSTGTGRRYLLSYLLLYFITFCETFVILSILGIPYPLTISLVTAVADVLPVLGPGLVFLPLGVYQLLIGQYSRALGLLIGWGVITLIRQIAEPRLVASTTKVHPLVMLAAVYFSLVAGDFWVLLYVVGFFLLYGPLREAGALPALGGDKNARKGP